jgi:hypothetical protein
MRRGYVELWYWGCIHTLSGGQLLEFVVHEQVVTTALLRNNMHTILFYEQINNLASSHCKSRKHLDGHRGGLHQLQSQLHLNNHRQD